MKKVAAKGARAPKKTTSAADAYHAARVSVGCAREAATSLEALTWLTRAAMWRDVARTARKEAA